MKMKKFACALAAAAMMFTSAPVFAADNSPVPGDVTITYPTEAEVPSASSDYTVDGVKVEIVKEELSEDAAKDVDTPEKVIDLIQNAGFTVPSGSTVVVTGGEYSAEIDDSKVDVNGNIQMVINMAGTEFAIGQSVFVLHQMKNGEWEVIQTVVNSNGDVVATLNGLSPVVIAKVMTDGTVKPTEPSTTPDTPSTDTKKPTNTATSTSTTKTTKTAEKTSPSTAC